MADAQSFSLEGISNLKKGLNNFWSNDEEIKEVEPDSNSHYRFHESLFASASDLILSEMLHLETTVLMVESAAIIVNEASLNSGFSSFSPQLYLTSLDAKDLCTIYFRATNQNAHGRLMASVKFLKDLMTRTAAIPTLKKGVSISRETLFAIIADPRCEGTEDYVDTIRELADEMIIAIARLCVQNVHLSESEVITYFFRFHTLWLLVELEPVVVRLRNIMAQRIKTRDSRLSMSTSSNNSLSTPSAAVASAHRAHFSAAAAAQQQPQQKMGREVATKAFNYPEHTNPDPTHHVVAKATAGKTSAHLNSSIVARTKPAVERGRNGRVSYDEGSVVNSDDSEDEKDDVISDLSGEIAERLSHQSLADNPPTSPAGSASSRNNDRMIATLSRGLTDHAPRTRSLTPANSRFVTSSNKLLLTPGMNACLTQLESLASQETLLSLEELKDSMARTGGCVIMTVQGFVLDLSIESFHYSGGRYINRHNFSPLALLKVSPLNPDQVTSFANQLNTVLPIYNPLHSIKSFRAFLDNQLKALLHPKQSPYDFIVNGIADSNVELFYSLKESFSNLLVHFLSETPESSEFFVVGWAFLMRFFLFTWNRAFARRSLDGWSHSAIDTMWRHRFFVDLRTTPPDKMGLLLTYALRFLHFRCTVCNEVGSVHGFCHNCHFTSLKVLRPFNLLDDMACAMIPNPAYLLQTVAFNAYLAANASTNPSLGFADFQKLTGARNEPKTIAASHASSVIAVDRYTHAATRVASVQHLLIPFICDIRSSHGDFF
jgi:hypothetical protein